MNFDRSVFIKTELERIEARKVMEAFDESRYACSKPQPKLQGDYQAWRAALNNLRAQQEHQGNRYDFNTTPACHLLQRHALTISCMACNKHIITNNRLVNMELLQTYAPDVWLLYNEELEIFKNKLDKELEALRKDAETVIA